MYNTIIFDLGGVLIDWNPDYVFDTIFDDPERKKFFYENICTPHWNEEQDAGRTLQAATDLLLDEHPEWQTEIAAYYGRWSEMLGDCIQGTVDIFKELKDSGKYKIYALTNWSAETFPIALEKFDFLHWFDGIVVSGTEMTRKPFPEFYQILLDRYEVAPSEAIFIDDNLRNVLAGKEMGIESIQFHSPEKLREELTALGVIGSH
ncbi:MAG: HAD-IA family hydrolase [Bacteroidetes bacterium]|nr:HAD-IA family hydrolase [Bacteroidota bacterium]